MYISENKGMLIQMNATTKLVHVVTGKKAEVYFEGTHAWCWEEGWSQGDVADFVGGRSKGNALIARMTGRGGWTVSK